MKLAVMNLVDLTHPLTPDVPTWYGNCGFQCEVTKDYGNEKGVKFRTQRLAFEAGVGTHMDAPAHCVPGGLTIADLSLEDLVVPCIMLDVSVIADESYKLTPQDIHDFEKRYGKIEAGVFVILYTGWSRFWHTPETYRNHYRFPCVTKEAALKLLERDVKGIGIDTLSPDRPESGYPVHDLFLNAGKYIIENIANAHLLPAKGSQMIALPLKVVGATEEPVRLIGFLPDTQQ